MADAELRAAERRGGDDPGDRARALIAAQRAGRVSQRDLELLAYLGDAGAQRALGQDPSGIPEGLLTWVEGLGAWGKRPPLKAAVAVLELAVGQWGGPDWAEARVLELRAWLADPTPDRIVALESAPEPPTLPRDPHVLVGWSPLVDAARVLARAPGERASAAVSRAVRSVRSSVLALRHKVGPDEARAQARAACVAAVRPAGDCRWTGTSVAWNATGETWARSCGRGCDAARRRRRRGGPW